MRWVSKVSGVFVTWVSSLALYTSFLRSYPRARGIIWPGSDAGLYDYTIQLNRSKNPSSVCVCVCSKSSLAVSLPGKNSIFHLIHLLRLRARAEGVGGGGAFLSQQISDSLSSKSSFDFPLLYIHLTFPYTLVVYIYIYIYPYGVHRCSRTHPLDHPFITYLTCP